MTYVHSRDGRAIPPPVDATPPPRPDPPAPPHPSTPGSPVPVPGILDGRGRPSIAPVAFDPERKLAFLTIVDEHGPIVQFSLDPPTTLRLGKDLLDVAEAMGETRW